MTETLVLGNGISRLSFDQLIKDWPGEVWGCNRAYLDYPEKLSRLTGHTEVMREAKAYREKHRLSFELWGGNIANGKQAEKAFTCPKRFQNDSGTTMVAQALHEGRSVAVCGFDLGGWDIHSPELENVPKFNWVDRWRELLNEYGADRVRFIGHDHKPYLLSDSPNDAYCDRYTNGRPHIADKKYLSVWEKFTGRKANDVQEKSTMKVRHKDGREVEMKDFIALKMAKKGKVEILKEKKEEKPEPEKKPAAKKAEK